MGLIADILLVAGTLGATFYCFVLSRRLSRFNDLERGVGGAVAVLSVQVDDMTRTLERAEVAARSSTSSLEELTGRADSAARRLELLVAAMHDLPEPTRAAVPQAADTSALPEHAPNETALEQEGHVPPEPAPEPEEMVQADVAAPSEEAVFVRHHAQIREAAE